MGVYHLGVWSHISGECVGLGLQSNDRLDTTQLDEEPFMIPGFQNMTQAVLEGMIWLSSYLENEALQQPKQNCQWTIYLNDLYCYNAVTRYLDKWMQQKGLTSRGQRIPHWPRWKGLYLMLHRLPSHFQVIWQYIPENQYRLQGLTQTLCEAVQVYVHGLHQVKALAEQSNAANEGNGVSGVSGVSRVSEASEASEARVT